MPRKKANPEQPGYFTTFQVAHLLGVSPPTVVNWIEAGLLGATKTPGGHRRIARGDLVHFAREHNYPLTRELLGLPPPARKVLIVDDEPDFCDMVRRYLMLKGSFEVEVADSGFAAGITIVRFRPSIILMDILMPDMDGFEVLRMLRADTEMRAIPVIACTAYRDPHIEERVRQESFQGYVEKPVRLERLLQVIEEALEGPLPRS